MINKKILLSLLTVGLLACIASAGTWAYFQDTLNSTGNNLTTATLASKYSLEETPITWLPFSDTGGNFGPFIVNNMVPDSIEHIIHPIHVENMGTTSAAVTATITPGTPVANVPNLLIEVGTQPIYTNGAFVTTPSPLVLNLGPVGAAGADPADASISYTFTDTGLNQNISE